MLFFNWKKGIIIIYTMSIPMSREEINFVRLLTRTENSIPERQSNDWRLEPYVKDIESRLASLKKMNTCQPSKDTLAEYSRRVEFLRGVMEAEKQPTVAEKAIANQLLFPGSATSASNKIHLQTKAQYLREMREELLGTTDDHTMSDGVRLRSVSSTSHQDDFDAVMQYHNSMQEKVAQDMVSLVQNLKQNSLLTGHIIKKDTEALIKSGEMADDRYSELKVESDKLETYTKRACNWCLWIMLGAVILIFMWMIIFIRLFPKR
ncbi:vesicle transport protein USE1 [Parasteatoda tepidariorum]|uniref:vesicle transport protein USE1 n=1 Tax=Parasteatoda tepidariorum TaxID=114398 RepID=UPI001C721807|nr:vesicle transport protein USE1 isoform X1 [Parasteatoda tepidariorum]